MDILLKGSSGQPVVDWQNFLISKEYLESVSQLGLFCDATDVATRQFQKDLSLDDDGEVGPMTVGKARELGFSFSDESPEDFDPNWPSPPDFSPPDQATRERLFGKFIFIPTPVPSNPESLRVTDNWVSKNMVTVVVPQLQGVQGGPLRNSLLFHSKGADQLTALFKAWEDAGLLPLVKSWGGSYAPRFIRGSRTTLSNHAFGTAFDINVAWNYLGAVPALAGKEGSVRKLVPLANEHGFYWGGHFPRKDGMHFELAKIL